MHQTLDNLSNAPEDELVSRAIGGDSEAFGQLYTRHIDAIYRYIFYRVGDTSLTEDLTEDVFLRAWEALPSYKQRRHPFSSWLYRIAHNLVVDFHRRRRSNEFDSSDFSTIGHGGPSPDELVAEQQDAAALARAVQQLEDEAQQVVLLRFVEGLSHREIAKIIGKSEGASRIIQHRALAALHANLSGQEQSYG